MSALTPSGSTRRWRRIRRAFAEQLAHLGQVNCWRFEHNAASTTRALVDQSPDCTRTITHGQRWVLACKHDRALEGDDTSPAYECIPCSNHAGGKTGTQTPSRWRAWA